MTGETRVNAAGLLEWHNKVSKTWRPAVYHDNIRADLIRQHNALGTYRFPRAAGSLPIDVTCYHYASRNWGTQRENWPAVLQQYEARPTDFVAAKPDIWTTALGEVILDLNNNAILAFPELPATISSKIEGEFLIAFHRLNHHITMPDVRARMLQNPKTGGAILQGTTNPLRVGNLSMRMTRCREKCGMISWTKRAGSDQIKEFMDRILPQACRDANSIAGFRDLHQYEIAQMHLPLAGQHPERTRRQKDLSDDKKQRVYNEQLERCRELKRKFDQSEAGKQEARAKQDSQVIKQEEEDDATISDNSDIARPNRRQRRIAVPMASRRATTTPSQLSQLASESNIWTQMGEGHALNSTQPVVGYTSLRGGSLNTAQAEASNLNSGLVSTTPFPTGHRNGRSAIPNTTSDPAFASQGVRPFEEMQGRTPHTHNAYQNPIGPYYPFTGNRYTGTSYRVPIGPYGTQPIPSVYGDGRQSMPQPYERPAPNQATMRSYREQLSNLMAARGEQIPRPLESVRRVRQRGSTSDNASVMRETGFEGQQDEQRRRRNEYNAPQQERQRQTLDVPTLSPHNAFEREQIPRQLESMQHWRRGGSAYITTETKAEEQGGVRRRRQSEGSSLQSTTELEQLGNRLTRTRRRGQPIAPQQETIAFSTSYRSNEVEPSETFPWDAQPPPRLLSPFAPSTTTPLPSSAPPTYPPETISPSRISTLPSPNYLDINPPLPQPRPSQILRSSVVPPSPQLQPQLPTQPVAQPLPAPEEPSTSSILSEHFASQEVFVVEGLRMQWLPSLGAWISDAEIERLVANVDEGDIDWGALATDEIPEEWVDFDA